MPLISHSVSPQERKRRYRTSGAASTSPSAAPRSKRVEEESSRKCVHALTGPLSQPVAACTVPVPCACRAALACQMKVFSAVLRSLGGKKGNIFKKLIKKKTKTVLLKRSRENSPPLLKYTCTFTQVGAQMEVTASAAAQFKGFKRRPCGRSRGTLNRKLSGTQAVPAPITSLNFCKVEK